MLVKFVGAVLITISSVMIGASLKKRLSDHVAELKETADFLIFAKRMIGYDMPLLADLFFQYEKEKSCGIIAAAAENLRSGESYEESVKKAFELPSSECTLTERERQKICGFFMQLGSSDIQSQHLLIDSALNQIEDMTAEAENEKERNSGVYMSAAVYIGVTLAILIV